MRGCHPSLDGGERAASCLWVCLFECQNLAKKKTAFWIAVASKEELSRRRRRQALSQPPSPHALRRGEASETEPRIFSGDLLEAVCFFPCTSHADS